MRSNTLAGLSLSAIALVSFAPSGSGPDEVRTHDGRVLVGDVTKKGSVLIIRTRTGEVQVSQDEVAGIRDESELRTELKRLAKGRTDDAFSNFELAKVAYSYGLTRDMWRHLDHAVEQMAEQENAEALQRRLAGFLVTLEPEVLPERYRDAGTKKRVNALVQLARGKDKAAKKAAILELLVAEQGADEALRLCAKTEPLPEQRLMALDALRRRGSQDSEALISSRAIWDKDSDVRGRAVEMIVEHGNPEAAVRRLARGLMHDVPGVRIRTAKALSGLGGDEAAALLVVAGPFAGTPISAIGGGLGVRSHMFEIENISYIRDFDVEIAQAAAVANPVIGNARRGVVLDVNVPAVITQRVQIEGAYRRALANLVGSDPGRDTKAWAGWLQGQRPAAGKLLPR